MIQPQLPPDGATDSSHWIPTMHSSDLSVSLSDPLNDCLSGQAGNRPDSAGHGISGVPFNWTALEEPPSKAHQSGFVHGSRMTIGRFVETKFIPEYVTSKRSSGQAFYQAMLKHVLIPEEVDRMFGVSPEATKKKLKAIPEWPYLGNIRFCDVGPDDILRLMSAALAQGYSIQTVKHIRNVISAVFSHAKQEGHFIGRNPVSLVKPPKHRRKHLVTLTPAQAIEAVSVMQYPEREMTLVGVFTGMSPAEIIGLQWGQVNLSNEEVNRNGMRIPPKTISVRKRWYRGKSEDVERNCVRNISIAPPLMGILQRLSRRSHSTAPEDHILVSSIGTPINQNNIVSRRLKPIARQLGVPSLSWQAFRRTQEVLAAELEKEFGFSARAMSVRIGTEEVEDGMWHGYALQPCSI